MFCPAAPLEGAPAKTSVTFGQKQSQETPDDVVRQVAEIAVCYLQWQKIRSLGQKNCV